MTRHYLQSAVVLAYEAPEAVVPGETRRSGYMVTDPSGFTRWRPKEEFERHATPLMPLWVEADNDRPREGVNEGRITQEMVDAFIVKIASVKEGRKSTVVTATLANGFEITKASSCVDPAMYDHTLGEKNAIARIKEDVWMLLGFLLSCCRNGYSHPELSTDSYHGHGTPKETVAAVVDKMNAGGKLHNHDITPSEPQVLHEDPTFVKFLKAPRRGAADVEGQTFPFVGLFECIADKDALGYVIHFRRGETIEHVTVARDEVEFWTKQRVAPPEMPSAEFVAMDVPPVSPGELIAVCDAPPAVAAEGVGVSMQEVYAKMNPDSPTPELVTHATQVFSRLIARMGDAVTFRDPTEQELKQSIPENRTKRLQVQEGFELTEAEKQVAATIVPREESESEFSWRDLCWAWGQLCPPSGALLPTSKPQAIGFAASEAPVYEIDGKTYQGFRAASPEIGRDVALLHTYPDHYLLLLAAAAREYLQNYDKMRQRLGVVETVLELDPVTLFVRKRYWLQSVRIAGEWLFPWNGHVNRNDPEPPHPIGEAPEGAAMPTVVDVEPKLPTADELIAKHGDLVKAVEAAETPEEKARINDLRYRLDFLGVGDDGGVSD